MTLRDQANEESQLSANLRPPVLGLLGIGVLACAVWAFGLGDNDSGDRLLRCAGISDGSARLACYDQAAVPHEPARGALAPIRSFSAEEAK